MSNNKSARDWAIFMNINYERFSDVERMTAIEHIAYAPTHNSITKAMMLDVIRYLLTAQQPRVLTLEEMKSLSTANDDALFDRDMTFVWLEAAADGYINITRPTYSFNPEWGNEDDSFYVYYIGTDVGDRLETCDYGKTWRCWTARPTDEQREAIPWDEPPKEEV